MLFLGIDIGGTGIKAALVDRQGTVVAYRERPTLAHEGATAVIRRVEEVAGFLLRQASAPVVACGVGSAGRIDHRQGTVVFASSNLPGWTGLELGPELARRLELPVVVDNDVNAAALAEGWIGSARGMSNYLMLTIGTGVGGALVVGGRLWRGARWGAGEVGHIPLYPHGLPCPCGGTGCAEQYVSAKALTRQANLLLEREKVPMEPFRGIRDVLSTAQRGPSPRREAARRAVDRFASDLALLLISLQNVFDPQVTVIGGGIIRLGYWWERLAEAVRQESRARSLTVRLRKAHCGPRAGVIGAARLAMLEMERNQGRSKARPPVQRPPAEPTSASH
ncbi:MAG TPA: ROK family protein [Symbiobacteriaceae bacterium]